MNAANTTLFAPGSPAVANPSKKSRKRPSAETAPKSRLRVPVLKNADVIVVGGGTGGIAAALKLAKAGASVFIGVPERYFGADICKFARWWQASDADTSATLARTLFCRGRNHRREVPLKPMDVKRMLDEAVLAAGIDFRFGCLPADLLVTDLREGCGVVFTGKTGTFAVRGKMIIDATWDASLLRCAGHPFTPWKGGKVEFTRVLFGAEAEGAAPAGTPLKPFPATQTGTGKPLPAFAYTAKLSVPEDTPEAWNNAEAAMRDRFWSRDMAGCSDASFYVPPAAIAVPGRKPADFDGDSLPFEAFETQFDDVFVISPSAPVTRRAAARLAHSATAITQGARLGKHLARLLRNTTPMAEFDPRHAGAVASCTPLMAHEACSDPRVLREAAEWLTPIRPPAQPQLPVLAEVDVLVAGGGTGGAPAAIAAARNGAKTLVIESLPGLGGVGTLGYISYYYYGFRRGFTNEITRAMQDLHSGEGKFNPGGWNPEHKAEWFRREIRKAGGSVWFDSLVSGVIMHGNAVAGVIVNTPYGRGIIKTGMVIDATGNADLAAAAGAPCTMVSDHDLAVQGTGLPDKPVRPGYNNTDYTFADDTDTLDTTRAFVVARQKFTHKFDLAHVLDTRERRQIIGDVTITPLDVYTGRPWHDTICLSRSNFDSHGFTTFPLFFILPPDHTELDAWTPMRAFLPQGIRGLAVTGLALSAQRDVMPVLRMQPDIQNHAYALGLAATMALGAGRDFRAVDIRALQRRLAALDILPQPALLLDDTPAALPDETVADAAFGDLDNHAELSALLTSPPVATPLLQTRLQIEKDPVLRLRIAKTLAVLGHDTGVPELLKALAGGWDKGWNYTGMGQFGRSLSPVDDVLVCLALLRHEPAAKKVFQLASLLTADDAFSHFRATALFCEAVPGKAATDLLTDLLLKPGVAGHAWTAIGEELGDVPEDRCDTSTRNRSLRELYLARALYHCGDCDGLARTILTDYASDVRGHFARHAAAILSGKA